MSEPMGVKVQGKYLALFQAYAEAWNPDDWYASAESNPRREELARAIAGMHSDILDLADAEQLITFLVVGMLINERLPRVKTGSSVEQCQSELCTLLVNYVESLPRRYHLTVSLPNFPSWWTEAEVPIAPDVAICTPADTAEKTEAVSKIVQALRDTQRQGTKQRPTVLRITVSGYGDYASDTPAVGRAVSLAKQVAYLLGVYGVTNTWGVAQEAPSLWACETDGSSGRTGMAPPSLSRMFNSLQVEESELNIFDINSGKGLLGSMRAAQTVEEKNQAVRSKLGPVCRVLEARDKPDYQTLAAAMEWYQDSIAADNQTVAFISACIGVEALIGTDEQENQMSDRLADRFAFMVGGNRAERATLRNEFRQLLTLRGKLVHGRQPRLRTAEREKLRRLQQILDQLIRKELLALLKS